MIENSKMKLKQVIVGLLVVVMFGFTYATLNYHNNQRQAENSYMIQQDVREFWQDYDRTYILEWLNGELHHHDEIIIEEFLIPLFNFQASINRMVENNAVTEDFAKIWKNDFCNFLAYERINELYDKMVNEGRFSPTLGEVCKE